MKISSQQLLEDLKSSRDIKIKVFNLGENLGMDFAFFSYYHSLQDLFPNVSLDLYRSNVDETNCIGFDNYQDKVNLPFNSLEVAVVKQRYPDGKDWVQKLNDGQYEIFSDDFRSVEGYDYVWTIGMASSPIWQRQYPEETKFIGSGDIRCVVESYVHEIGVLPSKDVEIDLGKDHDKIIPWERTVLEYLTYKKENYPFTFTEEFKQHPFGLHFKDYLRIGLRWPDHVRWYYSIDRQYEVIFDIIKKIKEAGKLVKIVYNLKDGEIGNNFNRGQTIDKLKQVQDMCDSCIFTYSWTQSPYYGRLTEQQELYKLSQYGIKNVIKVDLWEDLLMSTNCKVYLSDPGGFAEVICMTRKDPNTTFLFPTSFAHACTYITLNERKEPIYFKINPLSVSQCYVCRPTLSKPDDPEGYRTLHWTLQYKEDVRKIGDNCHGDDWKYFNEAQDSVFKDWYKATKDELVNAVVGGYING